MSSSDVYKSKDWIIEKAFIKIDNYEAMYKQSIVEPDEFWFQQGQRLDWFIPYTKVRDYSYEKNDLYIKWYEDGELNASYNCLDRHVEKNRDKIAKITDIGPQGGGHFFWPKMFPDQFTIDNKKKKICHVIIFSKYGCNSSFTIHYTKI